MFRSVLKNCEMCDKAYINSIFVPRFSVNSTAAAGATEQRGKAYEKRRKVRRKIVEACADRDEFCKYTLKRDSEQSTVKEALITYYFEDENFLPRVYPLTGSGPVAITGEELQIDLETAAESIRELGLLGAE